LVSQNERTLLNRPILMLHLSFWYTIDATSSAGLRHPFITERHQT